MSFIFFYLISGDILLFLLEASTQYQCMVCKTKTWYTFPTFSDSVNLYPLCQGFKFIFPTFMYLCCCFFKSIVPKFYCFSNLPFFSCGFFPYFMSPSNLQNVATSMFNIYKSRVSEYCKFTSVRLIHRVASKERKNERKEGNLFSQK